jgi:hypothetical protein
VCRLAPARKPTQFIAQGIVPEITGVLPLQDSAFFQAYRNPLKRHASPIVEPRRRIKCAPRFDIFPTFSSGDRSMVITSAHIQPIVALIAGVLILIMPRFLNLVVAIYLIFIGLAGLGLFKMFHM